MGSADDPPHRRGLERGAADALAPQALGPPVAPMKPLKATAAERAVETWLNSQGWETHRAVAQVVRKGPLVFSPSNDILGCVDILAVHPEQGIWMVQVTCQGTTDDGTPNGSGTNLSRRRRKLEAVRWPLQWIRISGGYLRVSLLETRVRLEAGSRRRREDYARIHDLTHEVAWQLTGEVVLPRAEPKPRPKKQPQTALAYVPGPEDPPL
jgi:hypothetical protein